MNIFSFISREGQVFKCCVFKTTKKVREQGCNIIKNMGNEKFKAQYYLFSFHVFILLQKSLLVIENYYFIEKEA